MGLFDDTIRDARRPLHGGWVRRRVAEEAESNLPEEDFSEEHMSSGMQTVFRFQNAESPAQPDEFREASHRSWPVADFSQEAVPGSTKTVFRFQNAESPAQPGEFREASHRSGVENHLPVGDPLSAGANVERPKPNATNVGITDISVRDDNRGSSLATGQEASLSPSKVEAANVKSDLQAAQSLVSSEPIEADWYRVTHQSETPEGSEQPVSLRGETFLSRPPGRGAHSETTYSMPVQEAGEIASSSPLRSSDARNTLAGRREAPAADTAPTPAALEQESAGDSGESTPARAPKDGATDKGTAAPPSRRPVRSPVAATGFAAPVPETAEQSSLIIGRIDVVVVARDTPAQPQTAAARAERAFLSRNYLKRL